MFGNFGQIAGILKDLPALKQRIETMKRELADARFTGISSDGTVTAVVTGECFVHDLSFTTSAPNPSSVAEAINLAEVQAKNEISKRISDATGGMSLPGLF